MAKKSILVDRQKLEAALNMAENNGPLSNLSELWSKATEIYNRTAEQPITHSVVALRVKEWNVVVKTQPGRKGRAMSDEQKAAMQAARGQRRPRSEKMKEFKTFDLLRQEMNLEADKRRFLPVLEAAEKGSMKAAIKLNCLECSNWLTTEVKHCPVEKCAFYPHRPYKPGSTDADEGSDPVDDYLFE
jgi:hypothetical protein